MPHSKSLAISLSAIAVLPFAMSVIVRLPMGVAIFESARVKETFKGAVAILVLLWGLYGLMWGLYGLLLGCRWIFNKLFMNK